MSSQWSLIEGHWRQKNLAMKKSWSKPTRSKSLSINYKDTNQCFQRPKSHKNQECSYRKLYFNKSRLSWEIRNPRKLKKDRVGKTYQLSLTTYLGWLVSCWSFGFLPFDWFPANLLINLTFEFLRPYLSVQCYISRGAKELPSPIWFHQNVIRWASFE